jgi:hypothetical protein
VDLANVLAVGRSGSIVSVASLVKVLLAAEGVSQLFAFDFHNVW